jgi:hypothetical protein
MSNPTAFLIVLGTGLLVLPFLIKLIYWVADEFGDLAGFVILCWALGVAMLSIAWAKS